MFRFSLISNIVLSAALTGILAWDLGGFRDDGEVQFLQRKLQLVEADNARLRTQASAWDRAARLEKEATERKRLEQTTSSLRNLKWRQPVEYEVMTRAGVRDLLSQKISAQYSDEELKKMSFALSTIGLLPEDFDLKETIIRLLGEQVAAFYDQHTHKLYMFEDARLDDPQNRMVLVHELTHALQDQNFDLKKFPLETKTNDDLAAACSALVEGDATAAMQAYAVQDLSLASLKGQLGAVFTQDLRELQKAPRYLRETLLFSYLRGAKFCEDAMIRGGWQAVSRIYSDPPKSTTEILHPDRYFSQPRFMPQAVDLSPANITWKPPLYSNVLGELGTRILLEDWIDSETTNQAAQGWLGDKYAVFDKGDLLVWKTRWETEADARQFATALQNALTKRLGAAPFEASAIPDSKPNGKRVAAIRSKPSNREVIMYIARETGGLRNLAQIFQ